MVSLLIEGGLLGTVAVTVAKKSTAALWNESIWCVAQRCAESCSEKAAGALTQSVASSCSDSFKLANGANKSLRCSCETELRYMNCRSNSIRSAGNFQSQLMSSRNSNARNGVGISRS